MCFFPGWTGITEANKTNNFAITEGVNSQILTVEIEGANESKSVHLKFCSTNNLCRQIKINTTDVRTFTVEGCQPTPKIVHSCAALKRVFTFSLSPDRLEILCNGHEWLLVQFPDTSPNDECTEVWARQFEYVTFLAEDNASIGFRWQPNSKSLRPLPKAENTTYVSSYLVKGRRLFYSSRNSINL